jgi:hypothetical protein
MSNYDERLRDYVDVKTRLRQALEKYPELIVVESPPVFQEVNGSTIVICEVAVRRSSQDELPVNAHASEPYPGKTPYTRDSEVANGFTSALGRALGYMGFGIEKSIASRDEVENRQDGPSTRQPPPKQRQPREDDAREIPRPATGGQTGLIKTMREERGLEPLQQGYYNALTFTGAQEVIEELKKVRKVS